MVWQHHRDVRAAHTHAPPKQSSHWMFHAYERPLPTISSCRAVLRRTSRYRSSPHLFLRAPLPHASPWRERRLARLVFSSSVRRAAHLGYNRVISPASSARPGGDGDPGFLLRQHKSHRVLSCPPDHFVSYTRARMMPVSDMVAKGLGAASSSIRQALRTYCARAATTRPLHIAHDISHQDTVVSTVSPRVPCALSTSHFSTSHIAIAALF